MQSSCRVFILILLKLDWVIQQAKEEFSRKDVIAALNMLPHNVEETLKKLLSYGYLIRIGQGAGARDKKRQ